MAFVTVRQFMIPIKNVVRVFASGDTAFFISENLDGAILNLTTGKAWKVGKVAGIDLVGKRFLREPKIITRAGELEFADESLLYVPASEYGYFDFGVVNHVMGRLEIDDPKFEDMVIGMKYVAVKTNGHWWFLPLDDDLPHIKLKAEVMTKHGMAKFIPGDEGFAVVELGKKRGAVLRLTPFGWTKIGSVALPENTGEWHVDSGKLFVKIKEGFMKSIWGVVDLRVLAR